MTLLLLLSSDARFFCMSLRSRVLRWEKVLGGIFACFRFRLSFFSRFTLVLDERCPGMRVWYRECSAYYVCPSGGLLRREGFPGVGVLLRTADCSWRAGLSIISRIPNFENSKFRILDFSLQLIKLYNLTGSYNCSLLLFHVCCCRIQLPITIAIHVVVAHTIATHNKFIQLAHTTAQIAVTYSLPIQLLIQLAHTTAHTPAHT